jgi:hypothetical protein
VQLDLPGFAQRGICCFDVAHNSFIGWRENGEQPPQFNDRRAQCKPELPGSPDFGLAKHSGAQDAQDGWPRWQAKR